MVHYRALVFAVAALGGIFDAFRMFQQLYNKPLTSVEEVQRTIEESMPTVESWLNWLSVSWFLSTNYGISTLF
jgi:hypothetical protein